MIGDPTHTSRLVIFYTSTAILHQSRPTMKALHLLKIMKNVDKKAGGKDTFDKMYWEDKQGYKYQ